MSRSTSRRYECWRGDCDTVAAKSGHWKLCFNHQKEKDAEEQAVWDAATGTLPLPQVEAMREAFKTKWSHP